MKTTKVKKSNRMWIIKVFKRLKTSQKILFLLWPIVLIVLLTQNLYTLMGLGSYQMDSITQDILQRMQIEFEEYLIPVETLINGLGTNIEKMLSLRPILLILISVVITT